MVPAMAADQEKVRRIFLIILLVLVSAVFVAMIRRFLVVLVLAAILSALASPVYRRFLRVWRGRKTLASASTLVILLGLVGIPFAGFLAIVVAEAIQVTQRVGPWIQTTLHDPRGVAALLARIPGYALIEPYQDVLLTKAGEVVQTMGGLVVQSVTAVGRVTFTFFFNLILLLYAMFFFLMDGKAILDKMLTYLPLPHEDEMRMVEKFVSVTRATLKGTLIIGAGQGTLGGLGFAVAGIEAPVFWGTVMAVFSLIPGAGTAIVWVPACIVLGAMGKTTAALVLAAYFALVVGSVDNILRPRLVGKDTQMHELFILLGTLGGIFLFGAVGFIIGPIMAALFVTLWDMYGVAFRDLLPGVGGSEGERPS
jgi:predicted PurR-regulated permease PerM